ncbi:protein-glutamine gamma-glutamyltransferase [Paenibacillus sp. N1-5-1-14]|uniref:protein-glutamine gamma-glutamyltransferase n=1 Tax=Paenibacillus radicibacter TaxID=2972488 RepID=UPI002158D29B|nr:protein-glutamine gamma-glutamyltransferase [Paenibacillus radicibacter]MCR8642961.1 protein-glutamine gamma-glutamyltransferase [Paenibacillus radicibacter]
MIVIDGHSNPPIDTTTMSMLEQDILQQKQQSATKYQYASEADLRFELKLRSLIVEAAQGLNASGAEFATFKDSRCNNRFWTRNDAGGFQLNPGVSPASAIRDIYDNGSEYAFECATAMVIVMYKAIIEAIGDTAFNANFPDLLLYDGHHDKHLRLIYEEGNTSYPGDILYFSNPDHDPERPEWQGENVIKMGDDLYYGHGIGIKSGQEIISALNATRKPGSTVSAYLTEKASHPDFNDIRRLTARDQFSGMPMIIPPRIVAQIGSQRYVG